jgi:hypothetical protein
MFDIDTKEIYRNLSNMADPSSIPTPHPCYALCHLPQNATPAEKVHIDKGLINSTMIRMSGVIIVNSASSSPLGSVGVLTLAAHNIQTISPTSGDNDGSSFPTGETPSKQRGISWGNSRLVYCSSVG